MLRHRQIQKAHYVFHAVHVTMISESRLRKVTMTSVTKEKADTMFSQNSHAILDNIYVRALAFVRHNALFETLPIKSNPFSHRGTTFIARSLWQRGKHRLIFLIRSDYKCQFTYNYKGMDLYNNKSSKMTSSAM